MATTTAATITVALVLFLLSCQRRKRSSRVREFTRFKCYASVLRVCCVYMYLLSLALVVVNVVVVLVGF